MSFARRMKKKAARMNPARPVIEVTPTDTHMHVLPGDSGRPQVVSLELALGILGYFESVLLDSDFAAHIKTHSKIPPKYIDEALRLKGAYNPATDSVVFIGDNKYV